MALPGRDTYRIAQRPDTELRPILPQPGGPEIVWLIPRVPCSAGVAVESVHKNDISQAVRLITSRDLDERCVIVQIFMHPRMTSDHRA
jgi:hypothetical protein